MGAHLPEGIDPKLGISYVDEAAKNAGKQLAILLTAFLFVDGNLVALPGSTRALSGDNTGPAQVAFTKVGDVLIVTERLTSHIDTFTLGDDGLAVEFATIISAFFIGLGCRRDG